jgi:hypothetical protein
MLLVFILISVFILFILSILANSALILWPVYGFLLSGGGGSSV